MRVRIELFLTALFGSADSVAAAEPPAPVSWLARLRRPRSSAQRRLPGTDGARIYLPPALDIANGSDETREHLRLAVEQAVRLARGSTAAALGNRGARVRDCFFLADAVGGG